MSLSKNDESLKFHAPDGKAQQQRNEFPAEWRINI